MAEPDDDKWAKFFSGGPEEPDPDSAAWLNYFGAAQPGKVAPDTSPFRVPKMLDQEYAGAVHGILGLPGGLEELGNKFGPKWMGHNRLFPTQGEIDAKTGYGMSQHPELAPQNAPERYAGALARVVPNALLIAATGGGAGPAVLSATGAELAGQLAHDVAPEQPWLQVGASIVGGIGGAGAAGKISKFLGSRALARDYSSAQKELDQALADAEKFKNPANKPKVDGGEVAGTKNALTLAQDTAFTGKEDARLAASRIVKASEGKLGATTGYVDETLGEARKASEAQAAQIDQDLEKTFTTTADTFGKSKTPQQAGEVLQESGLDWTKKDFVRQMQAARKPVQEAMVGAETPVPGFAGTLNSLIATGGDLKSVLGHFIPKLPEKVRTSLDEVLEAGQGTESKPVFSKTLTDAEGQPVQIGATAAKPAKQLTWDDVSDLRSAVGAAAKHATITKDPAEQQLQALYSALTGDMRSAAKGQGEEALAAFDNFNEVSTKLNTFKDNVLGKIVSASNDAKEKLLPGKVAEGLLATAAVDGSELAALREHLPKAADELAAYVLRQGPKALAGLSPEARVALFGEKEEGLNAAIATAAEARAGAESQLAQAAEVARQAKLRAKLDHDAAVEAAQEGAKTGNFSRSREVREAQKAREQAVAERAAAAEALTADQAQAKYIAGQRVRTAKQLVKEIAAKRAGSEPKSLSEQVKEGLGDLKSKLYSGLAGGTLAHQLAPGAMSAMGFQPGTMSNALLTVAGGLAGPAVLEAGRAFARNPATVRYPLGGAIAGSNSLTSPAK